MRSDSSLVVVALFGDVAGSLLASGAVELPFPPARSRCGVGTAVFARAGLVAEVSVLAAETAPLGSSAHK
jgi:hypothetical protein